MTAQPIEIPFGGGPSQATGRLLRGPNTLEANVNGDHDKAGYLRKARGFSRLALTTTVQGEAPEVVFVSVGTDRGELVIVGRDAVYGVGAPAPDIDGAALVRRGPSLVGNYEFGVIHTSPIGRET